MVWANANFLCYPIKQQQGDGLWGTTVKGVDIKFDKMEKIMGKHMIKKVLKNWPEKEQAPGVNTKNKMVFGLEYSLESKEIILKSMKNFKALACRFLGNKTFVLRVPKAEATGASMRKQVCSIHLTMMEWILTIELLWIGNS